MPNGCRHLSRKIGPNHPLAGKTVYIPTMAEGSAEAFAAVFRWLGVNATPTPASNERTRELGAKYTNGDECYPAKVTVGDFIRVIEQPGFDPKRTMFFMPTAEGPCRFGQYAPFLAKTLREIGYGDVQILSPTSKNSYVDLGEISTPFLRAGWRSVVAADVLRKALHRVRPYELVPGASDKAYHESVADLCTTIETSCADNDCQLQALVAAMTRARDRYRHVPAQFDRDVPLIGVVGEIFCRMNTFSNDDLIRKLESYGAEAWLSDIAEWIQYTNAEQLRKLKLLRRYWSVDMLKTRLRWYVQNSDEHAIVKPFKEDFAGYEEPDVYMIFECAQPYLPVTGVQGEMVLSVGKAAYLAQHGADGIIDISPFTCMNGIVSEAVYPKLSKDHGGIPIRNFYFDGTQSDLDRDLGIYMELARSYREKKPYARKYPPHFPKPGETAVLEKTG
jgi:predicted nucleotide-binding protein (sugar kinase/HSP70/actin superfamily)